jgi:low affinity Fe/Cu permease
MPDKKKIQKTALIVTRWIGSPLSVVIHTIIFISCFLAVEEGLVPFENMLLILTTLVSLEAIYLSILIQMTINYTTQELAEVGEDIEEMQEDIGEIQEDMGELQEDVEEIGEDVEEISEEVEGMSEEEATEEAEEDARKMEQKKTLVDIQGDLRKLMKDIERLQKNGQPPAPPVS